MVIKKPVAQTHIGLRKGFRKTQEVLQSIGHEKMFLL